MSGLDPRDFVAFAYGGAGPVHAAGYADAADVSRVATFDFGSVGGAFGTLSLDITQTYERTHVDILLSATGGGTYRSEAIEPLNQAIELLLDDARRDMHEEGFDLSALRFELEALLRFGQQRHTLPIPLPAEHVGDVAEIETLVARFVTAYGDAYGKGAVFLEAGVEVLGLRLSAVGDVAQPGGSGLSGPVDDPDPEPSGHRVAYWGFEHGERETPVYRRERVPSGLVLEGPALVESPDTVCVVPPGWSYHLDDKRVGWLERGGAE
jgi:N-methylhydantoinase A/oxoprolinase/acetone carboxylase beta subunit